MQPLGSINQWLAVVLTCGIYFFNVTTNHTTLPRPLPHLPSNERKKASNGAGFFSRVLDFLR